MMNAPTGGVLQGHQYAMALIRRQEQQIYARAGCISGRPIDFDDNPSEAGSALPSA
jgi:hypothetical protein